MTWRKRKDEEDKRKNISPFDFFSNWFFDDNIFNSIQKEMDEFMRNAFDDNQPGVARKTFGPYFYGRIVTMGPEGKPVVKEFGNLNQPTQPLDQIEQTIETSESLIDAFVEEKTIKIIAELPGVEKEDINIKATETKVTLKAENGIRQYSAEKELDVKIIPESASARYNNGVLEVIFKRKELSEDEEQFEVDIK